jgi:hypothetical protein
MRLALAAALVLAPLAARADSFTDQLDQARKDYEQGDLSTAISDLEFATQELRGKLNTAYLATFPPAPAGWTAQDEKPEESAAAFPGGGNMLKRTYRAATGEATIEAQLMTGGGFLQGLAAMFMNPAMLAAQPGAKRVRVGKDNAVVTYDPTDRTAKLMLDVGGKVTLMLDGKDLDNSDPLVQLANAWDVKKVREIAGL